MAFYGLELVPVADDRALRESSAPLCFEPRPCFDRARDISQAIRLIVSTRPGTLPITTEFGCRVHELMFRPLSAATRVAMCFFVEAAIRRWEPRITHLEVAIDESREPGVVRIRVRWRADANSGEELFAATANPGDLFVEGRR
jgi:phage baseplate assembly protein W